MKQNKIIFIREKDELIGVIDSNFVLFRMPYDEYENISDKSRFLMLLNFIYDRGILLGRKEEYERLDAIFNFASHKI